nr:hypothetical protein [Oligoflexales bacterium]
TEFELNSLVWKDEKISFLRFSGDQILAVTKNLRIGAKGGIIGVLKSAIVFPIFCSSGHVMCGFMQLPRWYWDEVLQVFRFK